LDGWLDVKEYTYTYDYLGEKGELKQLQGRHPDKLGELKGLKDYLTSRNAIVPVIEKLIDQGLIDENDILIELENQGVLYSFLSTARQLCIALLKATGKWIE